MAFCHLCRQLSTSINEDAKCSKIENIEMKTHVRVHSQHLRLVNGISMSEEEMFKKCFPTEVYENCDDQNINDPIKIALSAICRDLAKESKRKRNKTAHCFECDKDLKIFQNNREVFDHVMIHLGKRVFECRHCDYRFICKSSLRTHLMRHHQLSSNKANYVDLSATYSHEIIDLMTRCFGRQQASIQRVIPDKLCPKNKSRRNSKHPLLTFCYNIFAKRNQQITVLCFECDSKLRLFGKNGELRCSIAIDHACFHLKAPLFTCKQCQNHYCSRLAIEKHLRRVHSLRGAPENYIDFTGDHQQEIMEAIRCCFEQKEGSSLTSRTNARTFVSVKQTNSPVSNFCRALFVNRNNSAIWCQECRRQFRYFLKNELTNGVRTHLIIDHVYIHLKRALFNCRFCKYRGSTKGRIKNHLRSVHKLNMSSSHYEDLSGNYLDETMAMMTRCFAQTTTEAST